MNQDQVKSVYVGNLPEHTSEDSLRTYFEKLEMGKVGRIKLPCPGCSLLPSAAGKEPGAVQTQRLPCVLPLSCCTSSYPGHPWPCLCT